MLGRQNLRGQGGKGVIEPLPLLADTLTLARAGGGQIRITKLLFHPTGFSDLPTALSCSQLGETRDAHRGIYYLQMLPLFQIHT